MLFGLVTGRVLARHQLLDKVVVVREPCLVARPIAERFVSGEIPPLRERPGSVCLLSERRVDRGSSAVYLHRRRRLGHAESLRGILRTDARSISARHESTKVAAVPRQGMPERELVRSTKPKFAPEFAPISGHGGADPPAVTPRTGSTAFGRAARI